MKECTDVHEVTKHEYRVIGLRTVFLEWEGIMAFWDIGTLL